MIDFDRISNVTAGGNPVSFTHICTGDNLILIVGLRDTNGDQVTGITYNGIAMTLYLKYNLAGTDWDYIYYLIGPATGTHSITVTGSGSMTLIGHGVSYTGVSQGGFPDAGQNSAGTADHFTGTVITGADNAWTVIYADNEIGDFTAGTNTLIRNAGPTGSKVMVFADSDGPITPPGVASLALIMEGVDAYMYSMFSLAPAASSDTFIPQMIII